MKLSSLSLRDVKGLADQRLSFASGASGKPSNLVAVTGPPGAGKTRFLEAILAALEIAGPYLGVVRGEDWSYGARPATIELGLWLDDEERALVPSASAPAVAAVTLSSGGVAAHVDRALSHLLSRYEHTPTAAKREYFADNRQLSWAARADGLDALEQSLLRPTRDPHKYAFLPRFLTALRADDKKARAFAERLEMLSPTVRYRPAPDEDATICFRSRGGEGILAPARGLSRSEAEAVVIAATATLIGLERSIVFFDTPELFVPEDRVVSFVQALLKLGYDNQWIFATESAALLGGLDASSVIRIEPRAGGAR